MMRPSSFACTMMASILFFHSLRREVSRMILSARGLVRTAAAAAIALALVGGAVANTITGPSSSQSPYVVRSVPGVVTKAILSVGDSPAGSSYRMVGIPDGLGAFDNGDGTFTLFMNHELGSSQGEIRAHGARGAFVSKWTIEKDSLRVLQGEDLIKKLYTWSGAGWQVSNTDAAPARLNRLCSADLAPVSAFYNPASGNGYEGRLFLDGEEGGTTGRPWGHVVATGESYELTPWLGNMSFENVVARPASGDATVVMALDDGDTAVGQQVYLYRGTKANAGNPVEKAGLTNGKLYGVKVLGIPQSEYQKTDWKVGDEFEFELVDVSAHAGVGGPGPNTLDGDSQAKGVTNFQRPEDGSWDPSNPSDFYFDTTSSFGPRPDENRTGETRLWRLRFDDPTDPGQGGTIKLVVSGPVGTADSPSSTGTRARPRPDRRCSTTSR